MNASMKLLVIGLICAGSMAGCVSAKFKQRQMMRDKEAGTSGLYCEFVSGDEFPDVDVEINLRMNKRCDSNKNFSISGYKNSSEQYGLTYCCATKSGAFGAGALNSSAPVNSPAESKAGISNADLKSDGDIVIPIKDGKKDTKDKDAKDKDAKDKDTKDKDTKDKDTKDDKK